MNDGAGNWSSEPLREAFNDLSSIRPARSATITAERLDRSGPGGAAVVLDVAVARTADTERWRLTFDSMWADVSDFPLNDAALMVRVNVVEWWDTRDTESSPKWLITERLG